MPPPYSSQVRLLPNAVTVLALCAGLSAVQFALVGNPQIISECKGFEDTRGWTFYDSLDDAKTNLGKATAAVPQLASV